MISTQARSVVSAGVCDPAETCDGSGVSCPPDAKSAAECRAAVGDCDLAESCDGVGNDCPADGFDPFQCIDGDPCTSDACVAGNCQNDALPDDSPCPDGDLCNGDETCQSGVCTSGPPTWCGDGVVQGSCGEECDDGNTIDGDCCSSSCQIEPAETVCRPGVGCDPAEFCTGSDPNCPADLGSVDDDNDQVCDNLDNCLGVANPVDPNLPLWKTLTGGQRDDDADGYGNQCDGKFRLLSLAEPHVSGIDVFEFVTAIGWSQEVDVCGTTADVPCAKFKVADPVGSGTSVSGADIFAFIDLIGHLPGPSCCGGAPLTCEGDNCP